MSTIVDDNNLYLIENLKGLLQSKLWLLEDRLKTKQAESAYRALTEAQLRILAILRGQTLSLSEVARRLKVSRQAVHKTLSTLVNEGFLLLDNMPHNARDKQIIFTKKGEALKSAAIKALREIEEEIEAKLGEDNFKALKVLLSQDW